jgi:hypothetical protein
MGEVRINLTNLVAVGAMAFIFIWAANRGLSAAGFPQYKVA